MTDESPSIDKLLKNLDHAMLADRHRLRRQLLELRKKPDEAKLAQWVTRMQASCDQVLARRASLPVIRYDDSLPIAAKRDEIKAAQHQVLIIAGETGRVKPPSCRKSAWKSVAASMA
jgi:ATP-dependent helicase HrpA